MEVDSEQLYFRVWHLLTDAARGWSKQSTKGEYWDEHRVAAANIFDAESSKVVKPVHHYQQVQYNRASKEGKLFIFNYQITYGFLYCIYIFMVIQEILYFLKTVLFVQLNIWMSFH